MKLKKELSLFGLSLINIMWSVPEIVVNLIAPVMLKGRPLPVCIGFTTSVVVPKNRLSVRERNKYKLKFVP